MPIIEPPSQARIGGAFATLALVVAAGIALAWTRPTGLTPAIDEACFFEWASRRAPLSVWGEFLGPKPVPALLARSLAPLAGSDMTGFFATRGVFALFAVAIAWGVFLWRRTETGDDREALLVATTVASAPVVMNGAGRILSELPSLAFAVWGFAFWALADGRRESRASRAFVLAAFAAFVLAVFSRSTAISTVGAFLLYRAALRFATDRETPIPRRALGALAAPSAMGAALTLALLGWGAVFEFPHMPWRLVDASVAHFSRPPKSTVAAFAFGGGTLWFLAAAGTWIAVLGKTSDAKVAALWIWLAATAAPYLAITAMGGEVLPRHIADLAVPLATLGVVAVLRVPPALRSLSRPRFALAAVGTLVLAAIWWLAARVAHGWVSWFTHGWLQARPFAFSLTAAVAFAILIAHVAGKRTPSGRLLASLILGLGMVVGHQFIAFRGLPTENCAVSPILVERALARAGAAPDDALLVPGAHYDIDMMRLCLPRPAYLVDVYSDFRATGDRPSRPPKWAAVAHHYSAENANVLGQALERIGYRADAVPADRAGQAIIYRLDPSP